ncbi:MAG: TonB family protein [Bacteroidales bacterium]|nr:TonB family protein [Bacteroidales bacterium]
MGKYINTNSKEWCDLVFEGRNKRYGAYRIRQSSSKRHILAFIITILSAALLVSIPILIDKIEFYIFQNTESDYILEDYKYITESLTEVELQQLSKQYIPKPAKAEAEAAPQISKEQPLTAEQIKLRIPVIVDEPYLDEPIPEDLLPDTATSKPETKKEEVDESESDDGLYLTVEQMPSFPGGEDGLMEYIYKNLRYPYAASSKKIENTVICTFIIDKDGSVKQIEVTQSAHPYLDREAIRVLNTLPKWKPAKQHGKPIRVKYTLPIVFRLK